MVLVVFVKGFHFFERSHFFVLYVMLANFIDSFDKPWSTTNKYFLGFRKYLRVKSLNIIVSLVTYLCLATMRLLLILYYLSKHHGATLLLGLDP